MKKLIFGILTLALPTLMVAQPQDNHEKLRAMKVAFITQKLQLTSTEAQSFWPLYNNWEHRSTELKMEERKITKKIRRDFHVMTDSELDQSLNRQIAIKQKQLDLLKHFNVKYKEVLPIKKVAMLYAVEKQWKKELLYKIKNKGQ